MIPYVIGLGVYLLSVVVCLVAAKIYRGWRCSGGRVFVYMFKMSSYAKSFCGRQYKWDIDPQGGRLVNGTFCRWLFRRGKYCSPGYKYKISRVIFVPFYNTLLAINAMVFAVAHVLLWFVLGNVLDACAKRI